MNESVARAAAQAKSVWKTEDLYGRRTDDATDSFIGGPCMFNLYTSTLTLCEVSVFQFKDISCECTKLQRVALRSLQHGPIIIDG
jgi:hypothetical protein